VRASAPALIETPASAQKAVQRAIDQFSA